MSSSASTIPSQPAGGADSVGQLLLRPCPLEQAEALTRQLAHEHYENFTVVSFLLPRHLRQDFCNIYAFCRIADDCGDSTADAAAALASLGRLKELTRQCYSGSAQTGLFTALRGTIERHEIPAEPFLDLIDAFEQDQRVRRYDDFEHLLGYCRRSANPVGRLVLYLCGYRDLQRQLLSDQTCTGLQLANFWQDVRRDLLDLDRIYIPRESMEAAKLTEEELIEQIRSGRSDPRAREVIRLEVRRTQEFFDRGEKLLPLLHPSVRSQIGLFGMGGRAILRAIARQRFDTLARRPVVSRWQKGRLMLGALGAWARRLVSGRIPREQGGRP